VDLLPPSEKMQKMLWGRKKPMAGTLRPKGSYEERKRAAYVENKQTKLEEALRIVQLRNTVTPHKHAQFASHWGPLDCLVLTLLVAGITEDTGEETKTAIRFHRTTIPAKVDPHIIEGAWQCKYIYISMGDRTKLEHVEIVKTSTRISVRLSRAAFEASNSAQSPLQRQMLQNLRTLLC
jgi:hypothetical protein